MFSSFSLPLTSWLRPGSESWKRRSIALPPVEVHGIESAPDRRAKTLKQLIKANHTNHSIIYNNLMFHNHTPHILGSAYIMGATPDQLNVIYDEESRTLEPWKDSPGEVSKEDWRDFLGKKNYQRAFIDFFEDQLVGVGYDWKALLREFLYEGKEPLFNSLVSGLGHPLIHLAYAYELDSVTVAVEALGLTTCFYDDLHQYLDDPSYTKPSKFRSKSTLDLLQRLAKDKRLEGKRMGGDEDLMEVAVKHEDVLLDYWNAWDVDSAPYEQFAESQRTAAALVVATHSKGSSYDFFLLHLLTTSHAVRIMLPIIPPEYQLPLVRQWWLFVLMGYIRQNRPTIDLKRIDDYPLDGKTWKDSTRLALTSSHAQDAHYVKGIRAMQVAAETWGDESHFFLKAATKFSREFDGWGF